MQYSLQTLKLHYNQLTRDVATASVYKLRISFLSYT